MIDHKTASLLGDYLIINGICASSASLSTGKAGIALTLFELSRTLNDERIGHYAGNILSEALLIKGDNHSILHGTLGVGYVLLYLIEQGFIEASFDELFADHHQAIISHAKQDLNQNNAINLTPADLFYFARHATQNDQSREMLDLLIGKAIENLEIHIEGNVRCEDTPTLHLYCYQLMTLTYPIKYAKQMNRIKEKTASQDLPSSPARAFLDCLRHELGNNIGFEQAMDRSSPKNFSNTSKAMLVLLEWLSERSQSIQSVKTILNI